MEVTHWKINLKTVAIFYQRSSVRYEELQKIFIQEKFLVYRFPAYFEVRFAEHLVNLSTAVWKNLPYMKTYWKSIIESTETKLKLPLSKNFLKYALIYGNNIERHRQFIFKLLTIIFLIAFIFSIKYLYIFNKTKN